MGSLPLVYLLSPTERGGGVVGADGRLPSLAMPYQHVGEGRGEAVSSLHAAAESIDGNIFSTRHAINGPSMKWSTSFGYKSRSGPSGEEDQSLKRQPVLLPKTPSSFCRPFAAAIQLARGMFVPHSSIYSGVQRAQGVCACYGLKVV